MLRRTGQVRRKSIPRRTGGPDDPSRKNFLGMVPTAHRVIDVVHEKMRMAGEDIDVFVSLLSKVHKFIVWGMRWKHSKSTAVSLESARNSSLFHQRDEFVLRTFTQALLNLDADGIPCRFGGVTPGTPPDRRMP